VPYMGVLSVLSLFEGVACVECVNRS